MSDYSERNYLSVVEVAAHTGMSVRNIHRLVKAGELTASKSTSGQYRFKITDVQQLCSRQPEFDIGTGKSTVTTVRKFGTRQKIITGDSRRMTKTKDDSVHLAITSPPYFNAKMYSTTPNDMGNIHDLDVWMEEIGKVWEEVFRVLGPGRKFFLNLMNLPIRLNKTFRTLNLCGKTIDLCEEKGFVFKRDIVWHKTNGVRAHFGTYPYPGGILINHMHEFILEFEKPMKKLQPKYSHVTEQQKECSKLDKEFWLSVKNSDVWLMKPEKSGSNRNHCAPFPLELPHRLIKAYSYVGETILDPFLGSGTTLLVASQSGRNGVGYEINPEFCQAAQYRIKSNSRAIS